MGDGPHRQNLQNHFAHTNTHFVGYLKGQQLASAFASADVFVFPSRTETLGLVLLEAMAAGCPVIAARSGGIPDIVTDGVDGYLFDPNAPIQQAIDLTIKLLREKQEIATMRSNARKKAEQMGWSAAVRQLQEYYQRTLN